MREVTIVMVHDRYTEYDESRAVMQESISDWEQISEEEYKLLNQNWWKLAQHLDPHGNRRPVLLEKDSVPVRARINSIREWIQQEKIQAEKAEAERKAKAEERARKKILKNAQSERKLLEELLRKHPDLAKPTS